MTDDIAIVGGSVHVPGGRLGAWLDTESDAASCAPQDAHELLGRRGLLNKEPATRLALCAVHRALNRPVGARGGRERPDPRVAVVASSNLGNVNTVDRIVHALRTSGLKEVSALDAPNASSNVLASTVAIWFHCGGPNLMVCSGATSGLDAVHLAVILLRARRADRVVVVGAEPDDPVAARLHASRRTAGGRALLAGAGAVILERVGQSTLDSPVIESMHGGVSPEHEMRASDVGLVIGPSRLASGRRSIDIVGDAGDPYGALGVIQLALAAEVLRRSPSPERRRVVVMSGDEADGWRWAVVRA